MFILYEKYLFAHKFTPIQIQQYLWIFISIKNSKNITSNLDKNNNLKSFIYNIGMEKIYSFKELAVTINRTFGNQSKILQDTDAPADESVYHLSFKKARTVVEP